MKTVIMSLVGANNFASKYHDARGRGAAHFQRTIWSPALVQAWSMLPLSTQITTKMMGSKRSSAFRLVGTALENIEDIGYFPDNICTVDTKTTLFVNAWDPWSFVGNGNARDASLDGHMGRCTMMALLCWPKTNPSLTYVHTDLGKAQKVQEATESEEAKQEEEVEVEEVEEVEEPLEQVGGAIRLLSWNLDGFVDRPYHDRMQSVFEPTYHTLFDVIATMDTRVDNYRSLHTHLKKHVFDGSHASKQYPDKYQQGQAIFWRTGTFQCLEKTVVKLVATGVGVVVRLRHNHTGRNLVVVAIHLKSWPMSGDSCQAVRNRQVQQLLETLTKMKQDGDIVVVTGDWNEPHGKNVQKVANALDLFDVYRSVPKSHPTDTTMLDTGPWLVDHALVSTKNVSLHRVYETGRDFYKFDRDITDHYPLRFEFSLE